MWPFRLRADRVIGTLIKAPRQLHVGFDESLRTRTAQRRKQADDIRQDAAKWETRTDARSRLKAVK